MKRSKKLKRILKELYALEGGSKKKADKLSTKQLLKFGREFFSARPESKELKRALKELYAISGGSKDSGDVTLAQLTTEQRLKFFRSKAFRRYVKSENRAGRQVFWLRDVDKTQAAGDVFTFFLLERIRRGWLTQQQANRISKFLSTQKLAKSTEPMEVLRLFNEKLEGRDGLGLLDVWSHAYWPSQFGLTKKEKMRQVLEFAHLYADKVYPGVREENEALEAAGVIVVIVSNGDQELAQAIAPVLGIKPENVVGSHLIYGKNGRSTGVVHTYEIMGDPAWHKRPQPGKALSFHYWLHMNRERFGWDHIDDDKFVIAGRDGDSASSDGGMMILLKPPTIGNFMVDTPGEPGRLEEFYFVVRKYGWTKGQYFTLKQKPSRTGAKPV